MKNLQRFKPSQNDIGTIQSEESPLNMIPSIEKIARNVHSLEVYLSTSHDEHLMLYASALLKQNVALLKFGFNKLKLIQYSDTFKKIASKEKKSAKEGENTNDNTSSRDE